MACARLMCCMCCKISSKNCNKKKSSTFYVSLKREITNFSYQEKKEGKQQGHNPDKLSLGMFSDRKFHPRDILTAVFDKILKVVFVLEI